QSITRLPDYPITQFGSFAPVDPQPYTDLRREAGGHLQVWRPVCGPVGESGSRPGSERTDYVVERFSAAEAAGVRARNTHGSVRPFLRTAVRARVRHDDRQCRPAR